MPQIALSSKDLTAKPARDHDAIIAAIRAETDAFRRRDLQALSECWWHDDNALDVYVSSTAGISVIRGWAEIEKHLRQAIEGDMVCDIVEFGQENYRITRRGDVAWATFDGSARYSAGTSGDTFETRILERRDGFWRISYSSFFLRQDDSPGRLCVGVDATGNLVRASTSCLTALKDHAFLTVSAGRLRGKRRDWDRALQSAIVQAGQQHGFFRTTRFAEEMQGPANYPVILGQTDEGGVAVVHFAIRDGLTYVGVDGFDVLERRLGYAKTVFGLSEGQIRVARQIAIGQSLRTTAETLGISVNTARTHLSRLFDKTGVGTQAALVRLLLSVG